MAKVDRPSRPRGPRCRSGMILDVFGGVRSAPRIGRADKKSRFEQISFFCSRDLLCIDFGAPVAPLEVLGRPQGALRLPREALGSPKVPFWDPHGLSKWGPFSLLAGFGGPGGFERPPGPIFVCFLRFYQAKLQFSKKNMSFTCIRAILGACYAGKNAILKKKHQFYLHSRHLRSILGVYYAGKTDGWKLKNSLLRA